MTLSASSFSGRAHLRSRDGDPCLPLRFPLVPLAFPLAASLTFLPPSGSLIGHGTITAAPIPTSGDHLPCDSGQRLFSQAFHTTTTLSSCLHGHPSRCPPTCSPYDLHHNLGAPLTSSKRSHSHPDPSDDLPHGLAHLPVVTIALTFGPPRIPCGRLPAPLLGLPLIGTHRPPLTSSPTALFTSPLSRSPSRSGLLVPLDPIHHFPHSPAAPSPRPPCYANSPRQSLPGVRPLACYGDRPCVRAQLPPLALPLVTFCDLACGRSTPLFSSSRLP
ncbi:hypothetical protein BOTBODRAFT_181570 [Botryobasidium botryosum FD-172 SS1]|uniref:Uncharacterized protein n=1 Tax=Botryobasidium botryosum (strain FD-172 SS1) TaxID=930990 RepID=A0A067LT55_BOTB1|nr:hypothetical protein BOTBODRAFT_181570 [Botryobasidium botryosum FD-172 SS1]